MCTKKERADATNLLRSQEYCDTNLRLDVMEYHRKSNSSN